MLTWDAEASWRGFCLSPAIRYRGSRWLAEGSRCRRSKLRLVSRVCRRRGEAVELRIEHRSLGPAAQAGLAGRGLAGPSEGWMTSLRRGWICSVVKSTVANISNMFHVN